MKERNPKRTAEGNEGRDEAEQCVSVCVCVEDVSSLVFDWGVFPQKESERDQEFFLHSVLFAACLERVHHHGVRGFDGVMRAPIEGLSAFEHSDSFTVLGEGVAGHVVSFDRVEVV